jgi:glycosyltransferase involved in cell wall biosynthesis
LAELARAAGSPFSFEVIGAVQEKHRNYADVVRQRGEAANAEFFFDIPDDAVAKRLAHAGFAYLPFPDGASGKRGTLAAALINKLIVVTRHSAITPPWIVAATLHAGDPADALSQLTNLLENRATWNAVAQKCSAADGRYRWDNIARRHVDLYRSLLTSRRALARERTETSLTRWNLDLKEGTR